MVALPSASSKMGSRNRSPYQPRNNGVNHIHRFKKKVSGYQKPIHVNRGRSTAKKFNDFSFQHHNQIDLRNNQPPTIGLPYNDVYSEHAYQKIQNSPSIAPNLYWQANDIYQKNTNSGYQDERNYDFYKQPRQSPQQQRKPNHDIGHSSNGPNLNATMFMDTSAYNPTGDVLLEVSRTQYQTHSTSQQSDRRGHTLQVNEDANRLLASLDRDLINLVSAGNATLHSPELTNKSSLKIRRQNVIDKLYNKEEKQCPNCGIRFPKDDKKLFDDHLDEHFRKNSLQRRIKSGMENGTLIENRRRWYPNFAKIKSGDTVMTNTMKEEIEPEEKIPMIPIDDIVLEINKDIVKCNLCQEDFEQIYVNDQNLLYKTNFQAGTLKDGWYLKNAVWSGADVIHPTCSNE